jgi:hypothetical protein
MVGKPEAANTPVGRAMAPQLRHCISTDLEWFSPKHRFLGTMREGFASRWVA